MKIRWISEGIWNVRYHVPIHLVFRDFEKAFDSVAQWAKEQAMNNSNIDSRYRPLKHNIYENATIKIQLEARRANETHRN